MSGTWKRIWATTTAIDTLSFWLYNKHIQTGAHSEDHNQNPKEAQRTLCSLCPKHALQAEGSGQQDQV